MTTRTLATVGVVSIGFAAMAGAAPAAAATIPGCGDEPVGGTITLSGGTCELVFEAPGSYTWTMPADIAGLYALLLGGGGGANANGTSEGYAGGAGSVRFVDYTAATGSTVADVVVGDAGASASSSPTAGESSSVTVAAVASIADGGAASTSNYCIAEGNFSTYVGVGLGASGVFPLSAGNDCVLSYSTGINPAVSATDSYATATPAIFTSLNSEFGRGGRVLVTSDTIPTDLSIAGTGQGADVQYVAPSTVPNFTTVGGSGRVVFRYPEIGGVSGAGGGAVDGAGLAATGTETAPAIAFGAAGIALGALLLGLSRRRKSAGDAPAL